MIEAQCLFLKDALYYFSTFGEYLAKTNVIPCSLNRNYVNFNSLCELVDKFWNNGKTIF